MGQRQPSAACPVPEDTLTPLGLLGSMLTHKATQTHAGRGALPPHRSPVAHSPSASTMKQCQTSCLTSRFTQPSQNLSLSISPEPSLSNNWRLPTHLLKLYPMLLNTTATSCFHLWWICSSLRSSCFLRYLNNLFWIFSPEAWYTFQVPSCASVIKYWKCFVAKSHFLRTRSLQYPSNWRRQEQCARRMKVLPWQRCFESHTAICNSSHIATTWITVIP